MEMTDLLSADCEFDEKNCVRATKTKQLRMVFSQLVFMQLRLWSFVLAIIGAAAAPAYADSPGSWLFVPVLPAGPDAETERLLQAFESAMGEGAIRNVAAAEQFQRLRSREPVESTSEEIARIQAAAEAAVKKLGSNHLRHGQVALEQVESALDGERGDTYRRARERVQTLFDACSLEAMLLARAKRRDDAAAQMAHCVRAYPGFAPEDEPEIQPLFDAAIASGPHGILHIDGDSGCVVRANGIELGSVPLVMTLPIGVYRVQVECVPDVAGRIHSVRIEEGSNQFATDPLDASVHTRGGLWLQRPETADADGQALEHLFGATVVLLIAEDGSMRVRTDGRDIAVLSAGDDVRSIIPLLGSGTEATEAAPTPTAPELASTIDVSAAAPADATRSPLEYVAGISLVVVGTGSLAVSWVLYGQRYSIRSRNYGNVVPYETRDRFAGLGVSTLLVTAFGAGFLVAAEPFLASDDGIPSAAWVLAAGGLALAGAGLGFGQAHHCQPQPSHHISGSACGFVNDATFGPLLLLHGVPLLALPAMYGLRQWIGGGSTVVLGFNGSGFAVSGTF